MIRNNSRRRSLFIDLAFIILSIGLTITLSHWGIINTLLSHTQGYPALASFICGLFFTSAFTTAPAIAMFHGLTQTNSLWLVALCGSLGAVLGDIILFRFVRNRLSEDILSLMGKPLAHQVHHIFKLRIFHWFSPLVGAIIIASPILPDELAMAFVGFASSRVGPFLPFSFVANFAGIVIVVTAAQHLT